eukprot:1157935-Pelagomonas_calceolata.AAC.30
MPSELLGVAGQDAWVASFKVNVAVDYLWREGLLFFIRHQPHACCCSAFPRHSSWRQAQHCAAALNGWQQD